MMGSGQSGLTDLLLEMISGIVFSPAIVVARVCVFRVVKFISPAILKVRVSVVPWVHQ